MGNYNAFTANTAYTTLGPRASRISGNDTHWFKRYTWRACLGIFGPLALAAFYGLIAVYYLNNQPDFDIIPASTIDAIIPFYAWFLVSIFALDWTRTALCNYEAAAIMRPGLAPATAMKLFWHADNNWANPLWWLRALRNLFHGLLSPRKSYNSGIPHTFKTTPGWLWTFLSLVSVLVFVALPLNGLTMELSSVSIPGTRHASILGPGPTTFNALGRNGIAAIIGGTWRAGGKATPADSSYFYAPVGTKNVSLTYFEDAAQTNSATEITTFLGPAVDDLVSGTAFGMETSVRCGQVASKDLKLILKHQMPDGYEVNYAEPGPVSTNGTTGAAVDKFSMVWLNETKNGNVGFTPYSFIIAADGSYAGGTMYTSPSMIDVTLQSSIGGSPGNPNARTAYLEMFLWQGEDEDAEDPVLQGLLADDSPLLETTTSPFGRSEGLARYVGFAIQCTVRAATGHALLDPATRTYSGFQNTTVTAGAGDLDVWFPQVLAVMAIGDWDTSAYAPRQVSSGDLDSRLISLNQGIGRSAREMCVLDCDDSERAVTDSRYLALTPQNATLSLYRLLGHSIIVSTGAKSQDPWEDELFMLESARWLKEGPVPWQLVLALLGLWAIITSGLSVWTLFTKRWAPTLSGFELFRFGAQYHEEINQFSSGRFEACEVLENIPGLVGTLPGASATGSSGFVGLSELQADPDGTYVHDRR